MINTLTFVVEHWDCSSFSPPIKSRENFFFLLFIVGHDPSQRQVLRRRPFPGPQAGPHRWCRHRHGRQRGHGPDHWGSQGICPLQGISEFLEYVDLTILKLVSVLFFIQNQFR